MPKQFPCAIATVLLVSVLPAFSQNPPRLSGRLLQTEALQFCTSHILALGEWQEDLPVVVIDENKRRIEVLLAEAAGSCCSKAVPQQFSSESSTEDAEVVRLWLESDLGQEIRALDKAVETEQGRADFERFLDQAAKYELSKSRAELVDRLLLTTGLMEHVLKFLTLTRECQLEWAVALRGDKNQLSEEKKQQWVATIEEDLRRRLRLFSKMELIFTYRGLTDAELRRYLDFLNSKAGRWYFDRLREGTYEAVSLAKQEVFGNLTKR